jgi:hypothetical protein
MRLGKLRNQSGRFRDAKISCSYRESKHDFFAVQPVALSLYQSRYFFHLQWHINFSLRITFTFTQKLFFRLNSIMPIPVAARSKAWVYGHSLTGIVGSNPYGGMDVCPLWVLCCQVEVSATGWSLVQRSPTECGVSEVCVIVKPR